MYQWDDLKYLLALEENGSLTRAAKTLKTNPTTVSRHIKRLSDSYQKTLVTRTSNGEWVLTDEGLVFARAAKKCQREIEMLGAEDSEDETREVKISTIEFVASSVLTPSLVDLKAADSRISITLETCDRNVSLAFGEADLAIRLGRPKSGRLVVNKLGDLCMGVFSTQASARDEDWVGLPTEYDWVPEMQMALGYFRKPPTFRIGSYDCIRRIAVDQGIACIGPHVMMEGSAGLSAVRENDVVSHREVWSVYHESRRSDQTLALVRNWAKDCFAYL